MRWIKHMTDMSEDPRVKRVVRRHGGIAYAIYNYALERIGKRLETESPIPDLEETSEDIADFLRCDSVKVEEVILSCMNEGLFEQDEITGRILCTKIYKFIETSQTRSGELREMVKNYKASQTSVDRSTNVRDKSGRTEQNRTEQNIESTPNRNRADTVHHHTGRPINSTTYEELVKDYGKTLTDDYFQRVSDWEDSTGKKYKDHAATVRNWLKRDGVEKQTTQYKQVETVFDKEVV